jgi:hypothetical protein
MPQIMVQVTKLMHVSPNPISSMCLTLENVYMDQSFETSFQIRAKNTQRIVGKKVTRPLHNKEESLNTKNRPIK